MALSQTPESSLLGQAVQLQLRQVGAQVGLGAFALDRMSVEERFDYVSDQLTYALRTFVQTQHLADDTYTHVEHFPATWWQHWKHSHNGRFARWLKRRRPVKYTDVTLRVDVESMAAFPDSSIIVDPRLGAPVFWQSADRAVLRA